MTVCALVKSSDNVVVHVRVVEPTDWCPPDHYYVVLDNELRSKCKTGCVWDGATFIDPTPVSE